MRSKKTLTVIILFFLFFMSNVTYGVISFNGSDSGYDGDGEDSSGESSNISNAASSSLIRMLIIQGAGYYLKSHCYYQFFLNKIEMAEIEGVNYCDLQGVLNATVFYMERANISYLDLKNVAAGTPYNEVVVGELKGFDYDGFKEGKNFNREVYGKAKSFLEKGDITGLYCEMYSRSVVILEALNNLKGVIDGNSFPEMSILWELNQNFSNALFLGQYTAMIFSELQK